MNAIRPNVARRAAFPSAALLIFALLGQSAIGQFQPQIGADVAIAEPAGAASGASPKFPGGVVLPENRELRRKLDLVKKQLDAGEFSGAVQSLGEMLEKPDGKDFFLAADSSGINLRSFRAQLRELLAGLPAEGRRSYELQFGARAARQLREAVATGDVQSLQRVAAGYLHTEAGYEASFLLGLWHRDRAQWREAALCFGRLRDAGAAARYEPRLSLLLAECRLRSREAKLAEETLSALKKSDADARFELAGVGKDLYGQGADPLEWLNEQFPRSSNSADSRIAWTTHRGDATRNASVDAAAPLMVPRFSPVPISTAPSVLAAIEGERQAYGDQKATPLPMLWPLAVGDTVLMRTADGGQAIDLKTGRLLWPLGQEDRSRLENHGLQELFWREAAFGSLSTDGRYLYVVDGVRPPPDDVAAGAQPHMVFGGWLGFNPWGGFNSESQPGEASHNTLKAVDVRWGGALRWQVGGEDGAAEAGLAGWYFLGPPLAHAGALYAIAERESALSLVVLDPRSGRLEWSQELAVVENAIHLDPFRRMVGASPSISAGVVVCPLSCGGVVAVELATRSLLWAYQYPRSQHSRMEAGSGQFPQLRQGERWIDGSAILASGRVVLTPPEAEQIHCLDLLTGKLQWMVPRGENLFVACVHDDQVILAASRRLSAVNLSDGKPAWKTPVEWPAGAALSGRGVYAGERYFAPLSSAKIAAVDLSSGALAGQFPSPREIVPGNLIYHRGALISQGARYLEVFDELETLRRSTSAALAKNPNDARALYDQARIDLAEDRLPQAIDHLRRSYAVSPAPATRSLLITSLLEGRRRNLPNRDELAAALEALLK